MLHEYTAAGNTMGRHTTQGLRTRTTKQRRGSWQAERWYYSTL